jgi:hypothetical protein
VATIKASKRRQKAKAKALAKTQMTQNRKDYEKAKQRLLQQSRRSPDAINGFESGLPALVTIAGKSLDPLGGLDPF